MSVDFSRAVAACLTYGTGVDPARIEVVVRQALNDRTAHDSLLPSADDLVALDNTIRQAFAEAGLPPDQRVALVYGGPTRIKGYVFEAPKLPEIRGASALLDWVNEERVRLLWHERLDKMFGDQDLVDRCIIYAGGGAFLAFAPAEQGADLAVAIEREFTLHTLTANSAAVAAQFSVVELRYGRNPLSFWLDEFLVAWDDALLRTELERYYYPPPGDSFAALLTTDQIMPALPAEKRTIAHVEAARRFVHRKTFGELTTVLAMMFNRRRDERGYGEAQRFIPFYPMLPWAVKCDSSDVRPAVWQGRVAGEDRAYSEASARKRYVGQIIKKDNDAATRWYTSTFRHWCAPATLRERSWEQLWDTFLQHEGASTPYAQSLASCTNTDVLPANDLHEIGAASDPERYIGIIYADGNNVGRLIATLRTPQEFHDVSRHLSDTAVKAVFHGLGRHLVGPVKVKRHSGDVTVHPFEILTIGGDDLLLIVPGHCALDVALAIASTFERSLARSIPAPPDARASDALRGRYAGTTPLTVDPYTPSIGLSAGIIIAQENTPIFFLRELAEEALKRAKKLAGLHAGQRYYGGAVDFMVLKSIGMVADTIAAFREAAFADPFPRGEMNPKNQARKPFRRLTARPYTWHEFAGLLATARALRHSDFPRSQLYRLRRIVDDHPGTVATTMEYLYTRARLSERRREALMHSFELAWQPAVATGRRPLPPWLPVEHQSHETIWTDLVEIYDMVAVQHEEQ